MWMSGRARDSEASFTVQSSRMPARARARCHGAALLPRPSVGGGRVVLADMMDCMSHHREPEEGARHSSPTEDTSLQGDRRRP